MHVAVHIFISPLLATYSVDVPALHHQDDPPRIISGFRNRVHIPDALHRIGPTLRVPPCVKEARSLGRFRGTHRATEQIACLAHEITDTFCPDCNGACFRNMHFVFTGHIGI